MVFQKTKPVRRPVQQPPRRMSEGDILESFGNFSEVMDSATNDVMSQLI